MKLKAHCLFFIFFFFSVLTDPTIYLVKKGEIPFSHGVSIFWSTFKGSWYPTEQIDPEERLVATAVLDLPNFDSETCIEANATVFCEFNEKLFQTRLPTISLSVKDVVDDRYRIDLIDKVSAEFSVLALKVS